MRFLPLATLSAALAFGAIRAAAQDDKDLLPMSFVKPDSAMARQLEQDWHRLHADGREWAYCVTEWELKETRDADTIFVITAMRRAPVRAEQPHLIAEFTCRAANDRSMPIVHVHPGGDCTPSRADATYSVAHATPFGLILCGPRSTAGYTSQQFLWLSRGALAERGVAVASDGGRP